MKDSREQFGPVRRRAGDWAVPAGWVDIENRRTTYDARYGSDAAHTAIAIGTGVLVENNGIVRRVQSSASELGCVLLGLEKMRCG